jgi:hypothetical protein
MTSDQFIAAALRNPINKIISDELFHLALPDAAAADARGI